MAEVKKRVETLIEQLSDPSQCDQALVALIGEGKAAVPLLAGFLRSSKPSSLPQARLLAVEGLSTLKGADALNALIEAAKEQLAGIADPAVRLGEESVVSRAASALADFPDDPRVRTTLLKLLDQKPLLGVAEALEKLKDPRSVPSLIYWLEDDFVAEAASRAILACGSIGIPVLLDSLRERHTRYGREGGASQRRRARILQILYELAPPESIGNLDDLLDDPNEAVQLNAARLLLTKGSIGQRRKAFRAAIELLPSSQSQAVRADCEELLISHFEVGPEVVEEAIQRRRLMRESEDFWPHETTLSILMRVVRKGTSARGANR